MGDSKVGKRNEQQKQFIERQERGGVIQHEAEYGSTTTNKNTLYRLPEEDASPESIFYMSLVDVVKAYYKEMSGVFQQSDETDHISEDHWLREKRRHRSVMNKRLLAAERASGYKVSEPCTCNPEGFTDTKSDTYGRERCQNSHQATAWICHIQLAVSNS
jgi:hypothetical protein